jgi:hypothetical protein
MALDWYYSRKRGTHAAQYHEGRVQLGDWICLGDGWYRKSRAAMAISAVNPAAGAAWVAIK